MQNSNSPIQKNPFFGLRLVWGALVFSCLLYALILKIIVDRTPSENISISHFSQVVQTKFFAVAVVSAFALVTLSRLFPKFLFKSQLKKQVVSNQQQVLQCYWSGFVLGLVFLEGVALIGFLLVIEYKFMPIYWVFGFVAMANMLIRFPSWAYIKFLAEQVLNKPISF